MYKFFIFKSINGQWRWRFYALNNKIIAESGESYFNKEDAIKAINLLKQNCSTAQVEIIY